MNDHHIYYIHRSIHDLMIHGSNTLTLPTLFEYWCALRLSIEYNTPFTVWKDISPLSKANYNVPNNDMGVDCASSDFLKLIQVKYYGKDHTIGTHSLSTFLAFPFQMDKSIIPKLDLLLARTDYSKLSDYVKRAISKGNLTDHAFESITFMKECKDISINFIDEKIQQDLRFPLRPPQLDALKIIEQSDREMKNCILSIPTGVGKTRIVLEYIHRNDGEVLVFVPTLILMDQWYKEAILSGLNKNKVIRIGSGVVEKYDPNGVYSLVICLNNSIDKVCKHISSFQKIFIDEAHRIHLPHIYRDEELDITEEDCIEDKDTESDDDEETYLTTLKNLFRSKKNIVLMSATIDPHINYLYYSYFIREAINQGYLCDYQLICPIFTNCPDDSNIALYMIQRGECHCIVFCDSIKQADSFSEILNSLLPGCARSIHSELTKTNRDLYIQEFEASQIRFLVNVRVLVEGFNCPIASSCVFLHLPSNDTFAIQAIGRCLRLYPGKEIANIYLPFNRDEDAIDISRFITEIGKKDKVIQRACLDKTIGTYINLDVHRDKQIEDDSRDHMDIDEESIVELRFNAIYNSLGDIDQHGKDIWKGKCKKLIDFYSSKKRMPIERTGDIEEKKIVKWMYWQQMNFNNRRQIMKDEEIYELWRILRIKYNLLSKPELWMQMYERLVNFKTKEQDSEYTEEYFRNWIQVQQRNFKNKEQIVGTNEKIYNIWKEFRIRYNLLSKSELWMQSFVQLNDFYTINRRLPCRSSGNLEEKRLSIWMTSQQTTFRRKSEAMENEEIYNLWKEFRINHNLLLKPELWKQTYCKLIEFEMLHNRLPSVNSPDEKILNKWIQHQQTNFNNKTCMMKIEEIYNIWMTFRIEHNRN